MNCLKLISAKSEPFVIRLFTDKATSCNYDDFVNLFKNPIITGLVAEIFRLNTSRSLYVWERIRNFIKDQYGSCLKPISAKSEPFVIRLFTVIRLEKTPYNGIRKRHPTKIAASRSILLQLQIIYKLFAKASDRQILKQLRLQQ